MKTYSFHSRFVLALVVLLVSSSIPGGLNASTNRLFPDLTLRYPVGDTNASNPISNTEGPKTLLAADLNRDGLADVVAGNLDGSISVLLGRTNNTLSSQILVPASGLLSNCSLRALVVADFNGDSLLDVAAGDIAGKSVIMLLGNGDGTLTPSSRTPLGPVRAMAAADFNNDGFTDLLVACSPADCDFCSWYIYTNILERFLCILDGRGDGTFAPPRYLLSPGAGACFYDVAAADINGDGHPDALSLDFTRCVLNSTVTRARRLQIFENYGTGEFNRDWADRTLEMAGEGPRAFQVAYLDEQMVNGNPPPGATLDIIVANRDNATLDVFLNQGGLNFSSPISFHVIDAPRDVGVGDLDQDGYADLVIVNRNANSISVMRGLGNGMFTSDSLEYPTGVSPRLVALADMNGDGLLDAAVNNRVSGDISLFIGMTNLAGFAVPGGWYPAGISAVSVVAVDFNHDGYPDVATANLRSHDLRVRLNNRDGTLSNEVVYPVNFEPAVLVSADLNADGNPDLLVTCLGSTPEFTYGGQGSLVTLLGRSDGTFQAPLSSAMGSNIYQPYWLRLADLDADEVLDAVVGSVRGELAVFKGRGDGTFDPGARVGVATWGRPLGIALGDFNQDGLTDIATSQGILYLNDGHFFDGQDWVSGGIWGVYLWNGPIKHFNAGFQAWATETSDLDDDGRLDLMVALTFQRPDPIGVLYGFGDGSFTEPDVYQGPDVGAVAIVSRDMDGDGIKDLVVGNRCAATVIILRGLGDRGFEYGEIIYAFSVEHLAVADMNQDGRPDIVAVGNGLWVLLSGSQSSLGRPTQAQLAMEAPARSGLYINEIMALNEGFHVTNSTTPDWLEIYNNNPYNQFMAGWALTQITVDGVTNRWSFPTTNNLLIPPYGHLVVYCDRNAIGRPGLYANFSLSADGETLALVKASGAIEDLVRFPAIPADVSYARTFDGTRYFGYNPSPTLGAANQRPANLKPTAEKKDPYVGPGASSIALNARLFDDVAIAYAAVCYRLQGAGADFAEFPLHDDGLHGDKLASDGYFGALLPPMPAGAIIEYYFRAIDIEGQIDTSPDDPDNAATLYRLVAPQPNPSLRLSELVADNKTGLVDERGQYEDWIEVFNSGTTTVNLHDYVLTKDYFDHTTAWPFPTNRWLQPGQRAVVFCDNDASQGPLHATFKLLRSGDRVFLIQSNTWTITDSLSFGPLPTDTSFGVLGTGTNAQWLAWPTPGAANLAMPSQTAGSSPRTFSRILFKGGANFFTLRWLGASNSIYQTLWTTNFTAWNQTLTPQHLGEGLFQHSEPLVLSNRDRFYRILRQP